MGQIRIELMGSFGRARSKTFSAMTKGHASAIAEAIAYLATEEMPLAVVNDHQCHNDGEAPAQGFAGSVAIKRPSAG